jgi:dTDP-4-amino-4,6-dideoxygalactose transaminase
MNPMLPTADDISHLLKEIDSSRIYSNFGPISTRLADKFAEYLGCPPNLVATATNATLALEGAISTSGVPEDSEWDIPSWTFTATASAVLRSRMKLNFCDVTEDWRIRPSESAKHVIDVLPFGDEVNFERLKNYDALIIDAAASFDSLRSFYRSNVQKFAMVISLHATKNMPSGEGAIFVSNDSLWVQKFREWSNFGFQATSRESMTLGTNAKLSEYSAAVGLQSISAWEADSEVWRGQMNQAQSISTEAGFAMHPAMAKSFITPYWIVQFPDGDAKANAREILEKNLIETRDWWGQGCHKMSAFRNFKKGDLCKTDAISGTTLGLPFHKLLSGSDFERIKNVLMQLK